MKIPPRKPDGFAIVSAIFILVVLAVLGAFILNISAQQQIGSALDVQGTRAYQAARAGIEWGLYQQLQGGVACPAGSFNPPAATLSEFTVSVTCVATADPGGHGGPTVRVLTATACNQPNAGDCPNTVDPGSHYVERRIQVTF
ncbi:pilus assembly PilX N-terminal domain-containing protein [Sulfuricystis multivorans]|uniref:pilus assembly PilX N-terminal domain-containing protein n=1 Tax=Sulfuricystis multivorans TaxID=2211108 RepID=UPI000F82F3D7|nr:pilus assembly PilX N-terminal domain-containing protein [Sulfuricystis multivorans]